MTSTITPLFAQREPESARRTVLVIRGSGPKTARPARAEAADLILAGRNPRPAQALGDLQGLAKGECPAERDVLACVLPVQSEIGGVSAQNLSSRLAELRLAMTKAPAGILMSRTWTAPPA